MVSITVDGKEARGLGQEPGPVVLGRSDRLFHAAIPSIDGGGGGVRDEQQRRELLCHPRRRNRRTLLQMADGRLGRGRISNCLTPALLESEPRDHPGSTTWSILICAPLSISWIAIPSHFADPRVDRCCRRFRTSSVNAS
jgi:hypothetical protein